MGKIADHIKPLDIEYTVLRNSMTTVKDAPRAGAPNMGEKGDLPPAVTIPDFCAENVPYCIPFDGLGPVA